MNSPIVIAVPVSLFLVGVAVVSTGSDAAVMVYGGAMFALGLVCAIYSRWP